MKILIRNSDNVVMYADDTMVLSVDAVRGNQWVDHQFNTSNATIADAVLPNDYTGAVFSYIDGVWSVVDQETLDNNIAGKAEQERARIMQMVVTMAQARKALILGGVSITAVNAAIAAIVDPVERQLAETDWEYSTTVRRDSALVASLAPLLGLTDEQIDELFLLADSL
jgi:response regulator RpfG family c-di-GMP phosphodiesterase